MERPTPIHITTILMCITNSAGFFLINWSHRHATALFVIYAVLIAIGYFVLYFFWQRRNWARWLVEATSVLCLWNLWELRKPNRLPTNRPPIYNEHVRTLMVIVEALIAIYLLYYLNTRTAKEWFGRQTSRPLNQ